MSPSTQKLYLQRISILCVMCLLAFSAGWIFKDPFVKLLLGERKSMVTPEPVVQLTPAQKEFWDYLEQFNRLPENPTEEMIAVYNAKGIPPEFHRIKESETSVIGDIKGLTAHREIFPKRYPWVQPLLDQYNIKVPISSERFSGTAEEIGERYHNLLLVRREIKNTPENEKTFVANFLEGLLVVDFIYACGTDKDKRDGIQIIHGVFTVNHGLHTFKNLLGESIFDPASMDIGWPIIDAFPHIMRPMTLLLIGEGISESHYAYKVNFCKWKLLNNRVIDIEKKYEQGASRGMIHNLQAKLGLVSYSIYSSHSHELGRPADFPWQTVIKKHFKKLYPKDHTARFNQYMNLLDAAYPKTNS